MIGFRVEKRQKDFILQKIFLATPNSKQGIEARLGYDLPLAFTPMPTP